MKKSLIVVVFCMLLVSSILLSRQTHFGNSFVDINIHDTYFVLPYWLLSLLIILILIFAFSLTASLSDKINKRTYNYLLILSGTVIVALAIYLIKLINY
jgi:hypothetical protein